MLKLLRNILFVLMITPMITACVPLIIAGAGISAVGVHSAASNLSLSTQVDDFTIKSKAISIVNKMQDLKFNSNVGITVFNRIVLLIGQVPTQQDKHQIATKLSYIPGVRVVYNQLTVGPSISIKRYAKDTMITTEIKAKLLTHVNAAHFKVVTNQGIVYLLGVTTESEGQIAAEVASRVSGVRQVVKAYSFLPSPAQHRAAKIEHAQD